MKPVRPCSATRKTPAAKAKPSIRDPIEVYCRIRPLDNRNDVVCIRAKDDKTVVISPPENGLTARGAYKEVHYSFKYVFCENTSQKQLFDHVALPLIRDLFQGINGLLFTYGITSSGKTYTMTGTPQQPGILPRTLDVIFNTIRDCQTKKYVFKPDRMNGFEVQSSVEALLDQQRESGTRQRQKRKDVSMEWHNRSTDFSAVDDLNSDSCYSVFVSYVEIYNNYIYDLLEEMPTDRRAKFPQSKMLREDSNHSMYVFMTTEQEVRTAGEALELFCKGQQRRRISQTALNMESSRSHSVFTVRVVQGIVDSTGAEVLQDKGCVTVSQLSMVDLAGSERLVRTQNTGHKLREAGNINTSLMALRTCIEILRDNQAQGGSKMVPYRESKLTHLFKTFFEGEGKIRMVVCVNPCADDYDETTHVMRFAEMTQDVLISRATPVSTPVSLAMKPGRGNLFREAVRKARDEGIALDDILEPVAYSMGPDFPSLIMKDLSDRQTLLALIEYLDARKSRRDSWLLDLHQKQSIFRHNLQTMDQENIRVKQENTVLSMDLNVRMQQVKDLEQKLSSVESSNHVLQQRCFSCDRSMEALRLQLNDKELQLNQQAKEMRKMEVRSQNKIQFEQDRMQRAFDRRLAAKEAELERKMCFSKEKFRQLQEILNAGDWDFFAEGDHPLSAEAYFTRSKTTLGGGGDQATKPPVKTRVKSVSEPHISVETVPAPPTVQKSIAVANPRHRRSRSSTGDVWLEHKPIGNIDLGTVYQPKMKKKKSVSKLEVKDVTKPDVSKYVLEHQEQDSKGEVETQLYKADVIPSAGGGAQIIFNDVEKLKQESPPPTYNLRKRSAENTTLKEIEESCAVGVECHGVPSKVVRKTK